MSKVIEYGLPKTGTKSLGQALKMLGFQHASWNPELMSYFKKNTIKKSNFHKTPIYDFMKKFDSFTDGPWHNLDYSVINKHFPNSKYIYMMRDDESWINSMEKHFSPKYALSKNMHWVHNEWIISRDLHIKNLLKRKHEREIFFKKQCAIRPDSFLITSWDDGWAKICPFLNKKTPKAQFPSIK